MKNSDKQVTLLRGGGSKYCSFLQLMTAFVKWSFLTCPLPWWTERRGGSAWRDWVQEVRQDHTGEKKKRNLGINQLIKLFWPHNSQFNKCYCRYCNQYFCLNYSFVANSIWFCPFHLINKQNLAIVLSYNDNCFYMFHKMWNKRFLNCTSLFLLKF